MLEGIVGKSVPEISELEIVSKQPYGQLVDGIAIGVGQDLPSKNRVSINYFAPSDYTLIKRFKL